MSAALNSIVCSTEVDRKALLEKFYKLDVFKFGEYKLKDGRLSPVYIDCRGTVSSLDTIVPIASLIAAIIKEKQLKADFVVGIPYGAVILSTLVGERVNLPYIIRRKEAKGYGTRKLIEGIYKQGDRVLIIEDVVTSGSSICETADVLRQAGLVCEDAICVLDREQNGYENLKKRSITLHSLFTMTDALDYMIEKSQMTPEEKKVIQHQLAFPKWENATGENASH